MIAISKRGSKVVFSLNSQEVPEGSTYLWDFGDSIESNVASPTHIYQKKGSYLVKLVITKPNNEGEITEELNIDILSITSLQKTIAELVDSYIPISMLSDFTLVKSDYIDKWQLFLQPLVESEVSILNYSNELCYEALENQLIVELVAYDYISNSLVKVFANTAFNSTDITGSKSGNIKAMETGPSRAEFFDSADSEAKLFKLLKATLETLRDNIAALAKRLNIILPFSLNDPPILLPLL